MQRLVVLSLMLTACVSNPRNPTESGGPIVPEPPEKSVFIRASFDDDPSDFLGRFLPEGIAPEAIDETAARLSSRCAKHLTSRTMNASGSFEQTFNASSGVKGSLGVKPFGAISASHGADSGLLVKYKMTKKMVVAVKDADAFAQCCEAAPGECTSRMIGEFWYGTGTVSQFAGKQTDVEGNVSKGKVDAGFSYKDGWAWKRVSEFEDAYFAFRTVAGPSATRLCHSDWSRELPQSLDGQFFVGTAAVLAPEPKAREEAMLNARREVVKYLGVTISETYAGASTSMGGAIADQTLVGAAAQGVAKRVKDRCWTDAKMRSTPEGPFTEIRVLAFLPNAELAPAQVEAVEAMAEAAEKKKSPEAGNLRALATKMRR